MTMGDSPSGGSSQVVGNSAGTYLPPTTFAATGPVPAPSAETEIAATSGTPVPPVGTDTPAASAASTAPTPDTTTPVPTAITTPTVPVRSAYATRMATVFQNEIHRVSNDIKAINSEMANCKDEKEKIQMGQAIDDLLETLSDLSIETAKELKKIMVSTDNNNTSNNKRGSDFVDQGSSKKKLS
jgi:hypothetical protein